MERDESDLDIYPQSNTVASGFHPRQIGDLTVI